METERTTELPSLLDLGVWVVQPLHLVWVILGLSSKKVH